MMHHALLVQHPYGMNSDIHHFIIIIIIIVLLSLSLL